MDNEHDFLGIEDTLEEDDYAIIMGKDGTLKGIWIPSGSEDDDIPIAIKIFGVLMLTTKQAMELYIDPYRNF